MRAVVLAGGRGRRLLPYTMSFPKPLVPIGDIPIIEIVLRQLRWYGVSDVTISVGYLAHLIEAYLVTRGGIPGLRIEYLRESRPLGTAGAIGLLGDVSDDLLVINGDILTTLDFRRMIAFHRRERAVMTIAAYPRTVTVDLGVLEIDNESAITGYVEKPSLPYECSMGVYIYSPQAVRMIQPGEQLDFPDLVLRLLQAHERVLAYRSECYWLDIGRREDYERAAAEFPHLAPRLLPDASAEELATAVPDSSTAPASIATSAQGPRP